MGDRTGCTLTCREEDASNIESLLEQVDYGPNLSYADGPYHRMDFEEVNYGVLPQEALAALEPFAYDWDWGAGGGYTAGCCYHRPGKEDVEVWTEDQQLVEFCKDLLSMFGQVPTEAIRTYVSDKLATLTPEPLVLSTSTPEA